MLSVVLRGSASCRYATGEPWTRRERRCKSDTSCSFLLLEKKLTRILGLPLPSSQPHPSSPRGRNSADQPNRLGTRGTDPFADEKHLGSTCRPNCLDQPTDGAPARNKAVTDLRQLEGGFLRSQAHVTRQRQRQTVTDDMPPIAAILGFVKRSIRSNVCCPASLITPAWLAYRRGQYFRSPPVQKMSLIALVMMTTLMAGFSST